MNSMIVPSKRSTLEKKLDKLILIIFVGLFFMCLIGAIGRYTFFLNFSSIKISYHRATNLIEILFFKRMYTSMVKFLCDTTDTRD